MNFKRLFYKSTWSRSIEFHALKCVATNLVMRFVSIVMCTIYMVLYTLRADKNWIKAAEHFLAACLPIYRTRYKIRSQKTNKTCINPLDNTIIEGKSFSMCVCVCEAYLQPARHGYNSIHALPFILKLIHHKLLNLMGHIYTKVLYLVATTWCNLIESNKKQTHKWKPLNPNGYNITSSATKEYEPPYIQSGHNKWDTKWNWSQKVAEQNERTRIAAKCDRMLSIALRSRPNGKR